LSNRKHSSIVKRAVSAIPSVFLIFVCAASALRGSLAEERQMWSRFNDGMELDEVDVLRKERDSLLTKVAYLESEVSFRDLVLGLTLDVGSCVRAHAHEPRIVEQFLLSSGRLEA